MGRVPLSERGQDATPYPYILILGQDDNEKIMGEKLKKLGVNVRWNTELVGLDQNADGVTASTQAGRWDKPIPARALGCRMRWRTERRA